MRNIEGGYDIPEDEVQPKRTDASLETPEHGKDTSGNEEWRPSVQAVIEKLAKRAACACPACLLSVNAICMGLESF